MRRSSISGCLAAALALSTFLIPAAAQAAEGTDIIRINEIESSGGTPGDWVELINTGDTPVDVSGWSIRDSDDDHIFVLTADSVESTVVGPGGFLVVDVEVEFGLGGNDEARLFDPELTLVDEYAWTSHAATTYGRCPDGTGAFETTANPTRGTANDCLLVGSTSIVINEVESNGGTPGDWIELTNIGSATVDVSGWVIKDNDDSHVAVLPAGTMIAPGEFFIIEEAFLDFGLGNNDSVRVFGPDGVTIIDETTWAGHPPTTWGRCPDGTGDFAVTTSSTKAAANDCAAAVRHV